MKDRRRFSRAPRPRAAVATAPSPETRSAEDLGTANPNPPSLTRQDDIHDLLPTRENIDLKNHVERKMQKLERKTQRAMIELMQAEEDRRMQERGEQADE